MKRGDLIRHIEKHGCVFVREGKRHTLYENPAAEHEAAIPRHQEIKNWLAREICDELRVPRMP